MSSRGNKKKQYHMEGPGGVIQNHQSVEAVVMQDDGFKINLWRLPAPELAYHADNCSFQVISGAPTIYFYQIGPSGELLNAIALSFTRQAFEGATKTLQGLKDLLVKRTPEVYGMDSIKPPDLKVGSMTNDNFRKFPVQIIRAVCSADAAYIDFYNVPPLVAQQGINKKLLESSIQPTIRVYLTPLLLLRLLNIIDVKEISDEAK
jgi:hypothetical protein